MKSSEGKILSLFTNSQTSTTQSSERYKKRKDGLYQVEHRYVDVHGNEKKKSFYGKTQTIALNKRRAFVGDLERSLRADLAKTTVSDYIDQFLASYKPTVKPKTYKQKAYDMEVIRGHIGKKRIREINSTDIQNTLNIRSGMASSYIRKLKISLNQLFERACCDMLIPINPCKKIKMPPGTSNPHRELSDDEKDLVMQNKDHRFYTLVLVMMFAGLRPGEAIALRVQDVDFKKKLISIRESIVFDGATSILGGPKTEAGHREVPIVEPLLAPLENACASVKEGRIFLTAHGKEMTGSGFKRGMESFLYTLGVKKNGFRKRWTPEGTSFKSVKFTAYDLRHTFCTMLFDAGVDIKTAMLWMGHEDAQTTLNIYTHLSKRKRTHSASAYAAFASSVGNSIGKSENNEEKSAKNP